MKILGLQSKAQARIIARSKGKAGLIRDLNYERSMSSEYCTEGPPELGGKKSPRSTAEMKKGGRICRHRIPMRGQG